ncbi:MAG: uracil-DNA glycosylase [Patescibacteria group bacterium]|nr:uracil-DNA glycosylase [Patescibacteria group bacterium]MCL5431793.1 uracil-DNA glycosylase [Patescibacteria group bacterium]
MEDKQKLLDKIAEELEVSGGGPLGGPGINAVFGEGNPDAQIMFIGEAPGFHENQERRPFVGQAGKLLRKNLAVNGWREDEVYITNIVKFRPPENRDPTPQEIEFFRPFLDKQIEIINPKIIVTLGRFSMYKFLGIGVSISKIHGQPRTVGGHIIFPMFHPAAALRDGTMMKAFEQDFQKLRQMSDAKPEPEPEAKKNEAEQLKLV